MVRFSPSKNTVSLKIHRHLFLLVKPQDKSTATIQPPPCVLQKTRKKKTTRNHADKPSGPTRPDPPLGRARIRATRKCGWQLATNRGSRGSPRGLKSKGRARQPASAGDVRGARASGRASSPDVSQSNAEHHAVRGRDAAALRHFLGPSVGKSSCRKPVAEVRH